MFDLTGKKALVTGSSQGIGLSAALTLAEAGAKVWLNGSNADKAEAALGKVPGASAAVCDLGRPDCAEILYGMTGDVDILILNASIQVRASWDRITDEEFDRQIHVNLRASPKLIQAYAPHMLAQGWGRIVTVASVQQSKPHKDMLVYAASKAAQENMARNLAKQFAPFGVTVNNLAPGVIDTPRNKEALADESYRDDVLRGIPASFIGKPEDCRGQILLLCSDEGRYITGENIFIDGGMQL